MLRLSRVVMKFNQIFKGKQSDPRSREGSNEVDGGGGGGGKIQDIKSRCLSLQINETKLSSK